MWSQSMKTMQLLQIENIGFKNNGPCKQVTDKSSNVRVKRHQVVWYLQGVANNSNSNIYQKNVITN